MKLQDMKMQDMKMTDQVARHENAGHETAGRENVTLRDRNFSTIWLLGESDRIFIKILSHI